MSGNEQVVAGEIVNSAEISTPSVTIEPAYLERKAAIRRFNWLYLYLPVILVSILALALFGTLTWAALFADGGAQEVDRASGVADVFLTLIVLVPMTLVCAIFPLAGLGFFYWRRQRGSLIREPLTGLLQKAEGGISTADTKLSETTPKLAAPIIQVRGYIAAGFTMLDKLIDSVKNFIDQQTKRTD